MRDYRSSRAPRMPRTRRAFSPALRARRTSGDDERAHRSHRSAALPFTSCGGVQHLPSARQSQRAEFGGDTHARALAAARSSRCSAATAAAAAVTASNCSNARTQSHRSAAGVQPGNRAARQASRQAGAVQREHGASEARESIRARGAGTQIRTIAHHNGNGRNERDSCARETLTACRPSLSVSLVATTLPAQRVDTVCLIVVLNYASRLARVH